MKLSTLFLIVAAIAVVTMLLIHEILQPQIDDCARKGGRLVSGVDGYVCVEPRR